MRQLESLFVVVFLLSLLLPLIPRLWQERRWWVLIAFMPLIASLPHLLIEGWRVQMVPLYGLAILISVIRLFRLSATESKASRWSLIGRGLLFLVFAGSVLLPGWLLPMISLLAPTGQYSVGIVDHELVDEGRHRRLMVSVWYPAAESGTPAKLTEHPEAVTTGLERAFGLPGVSLLLQHLRYFKVAASQDAPIASAATPFPVLVFSHGLTGTRFQNSPTFQQLASHGYVVVAVDHTDAAAVTVFPDGETRPFDLQKFGIDANGIEPSTAVLLPIWVADQQLVYDTLERWNDSDPLLTGKLDLQRLGSFGHSFGGATALEVCIVDPRCQAAANLDGGINSSTSDHPATKPFLLMTAASSVKIKEANLLWGRRVSDALAQAYWIELPNSNHYSFTIVSLLSPLLTPAGSNARANLQTVDKYLQLFFDLHLREIPTSLLDRSSGESDVLWLSK